ncbi:MAG: hypothetical protein ACYDEC_16535 [Bacteroidia bacterium]
MYHNTLYFGGTFTNAAGTSVNNIARYSVPTGIESLTNSNEQVSIYPNPSSSSVNIAFNLSEQYTNKGL